VSAEDNNAIVRRWVDEAWNNGDFSSVEKLYPPSYTLHFGGMPETKGAEGLAGFISVYRNALPDLRMEIKDMLADGDRVVWRVTTSGTHLGDFLGIPPSGRPVSVNAIVISLFENGKWVEDWVNNDDLGLFQQIGVVPVMGAAEAIA